MTLTYTLTVQVADSMANACPPFLNACTCTCKYLPLSPIHSHVFNVDDDRGFVLQSQSSGHGCQLSDTWGKRNTNIRVVVD